MKIKDFLFNPVQVNCFVLWDDTKECIIIDPACYYDNEFKVLEKFITENSLIPKLAVATHFHFDHVMGAAKVCSHYNIPLAGHSRYVFMWEIGMFEQSMTFGFRMQEPPEPKILLEHGSIVNFGSTSLSVIHCPGHSPCGIALYNKESNSLFPGDILFNSSIGRTDLPGGDHEQLISGIKKNLLTLPDDTVVYPGHNESTTIESEKKGNPFFTF